MTHLNVRNWILTIKSALIQNEGNFMNKHKCSHLQNKLLHLYYNKAKLCWLLSKDQELMYCQVCAFACAPAVESSHPHCKASSLPTYKPTFTSICLVFHTVYANIKVVTSCIYYHLKCLQRYECVNYEICIFHWPGTAL